MLAYKEQLHPFRWQLVLVIALELPSEIAALGGGFNLAMVPLARGYSINRRLLWSALTDDSEQLVHDGSEMIDLLM